MPFPDIPGGFWPGAATPADPGSPAAPVPFTTSVVYPSALTWVGIARELTPGGVALPAATVPVVADDPEDTPQYLRDTGLRASMASVYGETLGVESSTFSFGGPAFLASDGYWLDNLFGDLSSVSNGTLGAAQPLSGPLAAGAISLTVPFPLGAVVAGSVIQILDGGASEIVIASGGSTGTVVNFTGTPCRFAHTAAATVALEITPASYTHTFAALNGGSGQPPTHSLTDVTGITAVTGARTYPGACVAQMSYNGSATKLLSRSIAGSAWLSATSPGVPVPAPAGVPLATWRAVLTVGGTPVFNVGDWAASFKRETLVYYSAQGGQTPFVTARGNLTAEFTVETSVAVDESPLANLTGPAQPLMFTLSNGLTGAQAQSIAITASQAQTVSSKPQRFDEVIGYTSGWEAVANATDTGGSGGLGPATVVLTNAVASY